MFVRFSAVLILLLCVTEVTAESPLKSDKGVIRGAKCAVAVGVAILNSVYGEEPVRKGGPYRAKLVHGEWQVAADLPSPKSGEVMFGGGYFITLSQKDGRVLFIGFDE